MTVGVSKASEESTGRCVGRKVALEADALDLQRVASVFEVV